MEILAADKELRCVKLNVLRLEKGLGIRVVPRYRHSAQYLGDIKTYREKLKEKKS